jgi:high-affinity K+ transport system ATPase subunit B
MNTLPPAAPADQDLQHLRLLSIFHYVVGGLTGLFALFPVIHLVMGLAIVMGGIPTKNSNEVWIGWLFVAFAIVFIVCGLTLAGLMVYAGRCLARQRRYVLCMVVAGLSCMVMPFGTVLGVFTLVVLMRPSVKTLFGRA